jgi:hypothetical protein
MSDNEIDAEDVENVDDADALFNQQCEDVLNDELFRGLVVMANSVNENCPSMADELTQMVCAVAGPGHKFTYKYIITSDLTEEQLNNVKQFVKKNIANSWTPENLLTPLYEMGVEFLYEYKNKNCEPLFKLRSKK